MLSATASVGSSLMVFNAVQNSSPSTVQTLTVTDTGTTPLTLGAGAFSLADAAGSADAARFALVNAASAPASLAPGASFGLTLTFSANAVATDAAVLNITTNDPANPVTAVTLHGIGTKGLGGTNQPSLATILQAYDIPTLVGEGPGDDNAATDATYPATPDPSSQEVDLQRLIKAGAGPVTIDVLASFVASGFSKSYVLGTYTPGDPTSLNQLFYTPGSENQTTSVQPQGATTFDPGSGEFGFYFVTNVQAAGRIGYSEDALNTWDTTDPRKFRFFPMETPAGAVVPDTYVMTSTEWNAPVGYDFTNIVAIVGNVKAAPGAPAGPVLGLQNLNAVPGSGTMVFNRIQNPNATLGDIVHDTGTLQVNNTGSQPLVISSYNLSSGWALVSPPAFPVTVAAGTHLDLSVKFVATTEPAVPHNETNGTINPTGGGVWNGNLVLTSNDPDSPTATVPLAGYWQNNSEDTEEPSLQTIVNLLFDWGTDINPTPIANLTETKGTGSTPTYYGEEVVSPYWAAADPAQSVTVEQLDSYHSEGSSSSIGWFPINGSSTKLFTTGTDVGQTLFPNGSNAASGSTANFTSTGEFGFEVDGDEYTVDGKNDTSGGGGHNIRFYPVRTAAGVLVPNTYLMGLDYSGESENFDFQDNVFLIQNVRPAAAVSGVGSPQSTAAPAAPTDLFASSAADVNTLQWAPVQDAALAGYDVYRAAGAAGPYTLITSSPVQTTTYTDTTAPASGTSYYQVTAVDSSLPSASLPAGASTANTAAAVTGAGAPVAGNDSVTTPAATAVTIDLVSQSTDNSAGTLIPSSVTVVTQPAHGTAAVNTADGSVTYTPAAGYSGTDTFTYTIGDDTGATSAPATVTITIPASSTTGTAPVAAALQESAVQGTPVTIDVAAGATDAGGAIDPGSVKIVVRPGSGALTVNAITGAITYTAGGNEVGTDSFQYTIAGTDGSVSAPATVQIAVGLEIGTVAVRTVRFEDSDGVVDTVSLTGGGSAVIDFLGGSTIDAVKKGTATLNGSGFSLNQIAVQNSSPRSVLQITGKDAAVLGGITVDGSIGRIVAPAAAIFTALAITGTAGGIDLGSLDHAAVTVGPGSSAKAALTLIAGDVGDTTLTSGTAIASLKVTNWNTGSISAPSIRSLSVSGSIDASIDTAGPLGTAKITGSVGGSWSVNGSSQSLSLGLLSSGWNGRFTGTVSSLTVRTGGFAGTMTAGAIGGLSIVGNDTGVITAGSIKTARITGTMAGASLTLTNPYAAKSTDLGRLSVSGQTSSSAITSAGSIGSISTGGIVSSAIDAGIEQGVTLPSVAADFVADAAIGSVAVTGRGAAFSNTVIGANVIGSVSLGTVDTANGSVPFGVGADSISSLSAILAPGGVIRLSRKNLASETTIAAYLAARNVSPGDFAIRTAT